MCDLSSARCAWLLLILAVLPCPPDVRAESAPPTLGQAVQAAFERYPGLASRAACHHAGPLRPEELPAEPDAAVHPEPVP